MGSFDTTSGFVIRLALVGGLVWPLTALAGSVVNLSPGGAAGGEQLPVSNIQGSPGNVTDNSIGTYYGDTADSATGSFYVTWATARSVWDVRWMTSSADISRKLVDFTVLQFTGSQPTNPPDWTPIPGCSVIGNAALVTNFVFSSPIFTKGVKIDYTNQYRPLTGELEIYGRPMLAETATVSAVNQQYGAPADALDGSPFTSWGSASLTNSPGWLIADFGRPRTLAGVRLRFRVQATYYDAPQNWELQSWDTLLNNWVDFCSTNNWPSGIDLCEVDLMPFVTTTKVRLYASVPRTAANFPQGSLGVVELELLAIIPAKGTVVVVQ